MWHCNAQISSFPLFSLVEVVDVSLFLSRKEAHSYRDDGRGGGRWEEARTHENGPLPLCCSMAPLSPVKEERYYGSGDGTFMLIVLMVLSESFA